jgi:hypothetical protein
LKFSQSNTASRRRFDNVTMPPKALPTRKSTVKDGGRRMGHFLPGGVCCFLGTEAHARKREVQHGSILTNLNSFGGRGK